MVWPAVIAAGASLVGSAANWFSGKANRDWNEEMWHKQNEYNSPKNQMSRLEEAGINPNSVVGHGSIVGNTAGQAPQSNLPTSLRPAEGVLEALNARIDLKNKAAQNEQIAAQTRNLDEQNKLIQAQAGVAKAQENQTKANTVQTNVDTATKQRKYDILEGKRLGALDDDHYLYKGVDRVRSYINDHYTSWWNSAKRFFRGN